MGYESFRLVARIAGASLPGMTESSRAATAQARHRARFWGETAVALVSGVLAIVMVFWRDWIEARTGFDPDQHDGSVEWLIVASLVFLCMLASVAGRVERRRAWPGTEADDVQAGPRRPRPGPGTGAT